MLPVAAGIGGGSADAAAALRLLARLNDLALDDPRLIEVAQLTGADVPVCLASRACVMTGVGETLLPLSLPKMPCVMVNPRVPVATKDVFEALGLRNGELLVGATDVIQATAWPEAGGSIEDWVEALAAGANDLEAPAMRIQPVIGEVLVGAQRHQWGLAGADVGIGRDLLCDLREHRRGAARGAENPARSPAMVGACGRAELDLHRCGIEVRHASLVPHHGFGPALRPGRARAHDEVVNATAPGRTPPPARARSSSARPETAPARRPPSRRNAGRG